MCCSCVWLGALVSTVIDGAPSTDGDSVLSAESVESVYVEGVMSTADDVYGSGASGFDGVGSAVVVGSMVDEALASTVIPGKVSGIPGVAAVGLCVSADVSA